MNGEIIKKWITEIGYVRLFLLVICGVFLILVSMPEKKEEILLEESTVPSSNLTDKNDTYVKKMEQKLEDTLEKIKGVGKVKVMITLASSSEAIVNKDESIEESTQTQDGDDKKNTINSVRQEETVLTEEDGEQKPYVLKEVEPVVEGVLVIMEGGDNTLVVNAVTEAVQALFHVELHKIKVLKMEDES